MIERNLFLEKISILNEARKSDADGNLKKGRYEHTYEFYRLFVLRDNMTFIVLYASLDSKRIIKGLRHDSLNESIFIWGIQWPAKEMSSRWICTMAWGRCFYLN